MPAVPGFGGQARTNNLGPVPKLLPGGYRNCIAGADRLIRQQPKGIALCQVGGIPVHEKSPPGKSGEAYPMLVLG